MKQYKIFRNALCFSSLLLTNLFFTVLLFTSANLSLNLILSDAFENLKLVTALHFFNHCSITAWANRLFAQIHKYFLIFIFICTFYLELSIETATKDFLYSMQSYDLCSTLFWFYQHGDWCQWSFVMLCEHTLLCDADEYEWIFKDGWLNIMNDFSWLCELFLKLAIKIGYKLQTSANFSYRCFTMF